MEMKEIPSSEIVLTTLYNLLKMDGLKILIQFLQYF